jgi:intergrase/recombinase
LRSAIPKVRCGVDLKIPSESEIIASLGRLDDSPQKYWALYNLLLDSGLRLVEAVTLINEFKDATKVNGFYRCSLANFRGTKTAYFGHFSEATFNTIRNVDEEISYDASSRYFYKVECVRPKYLRKFCFDKMIELEVPESIADFIQGRVARRVGAKHYMALARQASKFYPRYQEYVEKLRRG